MPVPDHHSLNLNSLLVTRKMTIFHQGFRMGEKVVPRTHERSELGHAIIRQNSDGKQRVREVIPVPDSLWKETTFIGLCTGRWLVSEMPWSDYFYNA